MKMDEEWARDWIIDKWIHMRVLDNDRDLKIWFQQRLRIVMLIEILTI